jgi:hypothetical protein
VTLAFHWRPGKVSFEAWRGGIGEKGRAIAEHTFVAGVPQPGDQKTHIGFCRYGNSPIPMKEPAEVIIERFQYAP